MSTRFEIEFPDEDMDTATAAAFGLMLDMFIRDETDHSKATIRILMTNADA